MTKAQTQLQELLAGAQKDLPATSTVDIDGQEMKQSDIVAKLEGWIQLYAQKDAAKATANGAVQSLKAIEPEVTKFKVSFGQALRQVLGKSSPLLGDFGLVVTQRKAPSAQTRILAQAKNSATRAARKTMGAVQKKAVTGPGVKSVTVAPYVKPSVESVGSQGATPTGASAPDAVAAPEVTGSAGSVPIGGGGK